LVETYARVLESLKTLDSRSESYFAGYTPSSYRLWDSKNEK